VCVCVCERVTHRHSSLAWRKGGEKEAHCAYSGGKSQDHRPAESHQTVSCDRLDSCHTSPNFDERHHKGKDLDKAGWSCSEGWWQAGAARRRSGRSGR
jgi:hypothetical protein